MNIFETIESEFDFSFPKKYMQLLNEFNLYLELKKDERIYDIYSTRKIFSKIENGIYYFQYINAWNINKKSNNFLNFEKTFVFGGTSDGIRLFFDLSDMSIWEYWLDDGNNVKLFNSFDELYKNAKILDKE